ncbi:MAG: hypothetical protein U0105_13140 [Candidatus Obscuribacterales bacterium]
MNYPSKPDWQHGEDDRSPPKPKLQLEPAGGGPGTRRPTAIGTGDFSADGSHIDLTGLPVVALGLAPFLTRKFKSCSKRPRRSDGDSPSRENPADLPTRSWTALGLP